ncbi:MAG: methylenetetrahydrofolate reductase [NAD(P)H] [Myxococcales bacterium]|nr:methylenetetrahydrofolate reductase [NAD(P)H] [Myxococcales bacterium]
MRISELFERNQPVFSFEFFPPKTDKGFRLLYRTIEELKPLDPGYVSVTWGAGGSTRRKTVDIVIQIQNDIGLTAMAHLSCIGSGRDQLRETLGKLTEGGIENVLALGGDRPEGYEPPPDSFTYANELAAFIRGDFDFSVGGACYPETHPLAESPEKDLARLVDKVNAGVHFLITQLFYDNADFFAFEARAREAGIEVPIVPGIMPIISAANNRRIAKLSQARIPEELESRLTEVEHDDALTMEVGVEWATLQCRELIERGVSGIHFYTMNKSPATRHVFRNLQQ